MEIGSDFPINFNTIKRNSSIRSIFDYLSGYNITFYNSARSALKALVKKGCKIALPTYICDSVVDALCECSIVWIRLNNDFSYDKDHLEKILDEGVEYLFLMHYFDAFQPKYILDLMIDKKKNKDFTIIEDTTHSLFSSLSTVGDYMICSLRKWFAVPDGGIMYTKRINNIPNMVGYLNHKKSLGMLLKGYRLKINSQFTEDLKAVERKLLVSGEEDFCNNIGNFSISKLSYFLLQQADIVKMIDKRLKNARALTKELRRRNIFFLDFKDGFIPYVIPIFVENRDSLRKYLIEKKIYLPVHWPIKMKNHNSLLGSKILSIVIDHRYSKRDMKKIVNEITVFSKEMQI